MYHLSSKQNSNKKKATLVPFWLVFFFNDFAFVFAAVAAAAA